MPRSLKILPLVVDKSHTDFKLKDEVKLVFSQQGNDKELRPT